MSGAPGGIRTPYPLVRSQVLYPSELRARGPMITPGRACPAGTDVLAFAAERPMKRPRQLALWPTARTAAEQVFNGRAALAAQIRAIRRRRKLTQEALAERAGIHRSYLSGLERAR